MTPFDLILQGIVLGIAVAVPLGPVNITMIDRGLRHGFVAAILVGCGACVVDLMYILVAYAGADPLSRQAWARMALFGAGALVLSWLGGSAIRSAMLPVKEAGPGEGAPDLARARGPFAAGILMTLMNPMTIASWLGILGASLAGRERYGVVVEALYIAALIGGCMIWVVALAALLHFGRRVVRGPILRAVSVVAGLSLIGFGVHFAIKAIT